MCRGLALPDIGVKLKVTKSSTVLMMVPCLTGGKLTGTLVFQGPKQAIRKLRGPFLRVALKKGLLEDKSATDEFDDMKKQLNGALTDIAKLKEAVVKLKKMVAMRWDNEASDPF